MDGKIHQQLFSRVVVDYAARFAGIDNLIQVETVLGVAVTIRMAFPVFLPYVMRLRLPSHNHMKNN
ncbi:MAG: hypothetical protein PHQ11_04985 [Paludibacter sp.]|nr:hypothetical protein [Paludibacter sp.]